MVGGEDPPIAPGWAREQLHTYFDSFTGWGTQGDEFSHMVPSSHSTLIMTTPLFGQLTIFITFFSFPSLPREGYYQMPYYGDGVRSEVVHLLSVLR